MTDVAVTGATGFIGQVVCANLRQRGIEVLALSRDLSAAGNGRSGERACIHLAGENNLHKVDSQFQNVRDEALKLAEKVLAQGFSKIIFTSSAAVYGDGNVYPRREDEPPAPRSAYAKIKIELEQLFLASGNSVARLANVYGPGMSPDNVISGILRQISGSVPLRLHTTKPVRDFIDVRDASAALVSLVLNEARGVFNVGTGVGTSIGDLARTILMLAGENGREVFAETDSLLSHLVLDSRKMQQLGWRAEVALQDGLKRLIVGAKS